MERVKIGEGTVAHESNDEFWVLDTMDSYSVMRNKITHSESLVSFKHDDDGLGIAIRYSDYLANRSNLND